MKAPSQKQMQKACDKFNADYPVDTKIIVYPGRVGSQSRPAIVCEPGAYIMQGHTAVAMTDLGVYALTHIASREASHDK